MRLHHVQVACTPGREDLARLFYGRAIGLVEVDKPDALKPLGGVWFRSHDDHGAVSAEVHVGVEEPFAPARKAHAALQLATVGEFQDTAARLMSLGFGIDWRDRDTYPGYVRLHTHDPEGNRIELMAPAP